MSQWLAAFGGFVLAQVALAAILRWVGVLYVELITQPPEVRRAQTVLPILFLHSGPWVIAILIFGAVQLFGAPERHWRPWLIGGFVAGSAFILGALFVGLRKWRPKGGNST